jgi:hypothetical protein
MTDLKNAKGAPSAQGALAKSGAPSATFRRSPDTRPINLQAAGGASMTEPEAFDRACHEIVRIIETAQPPSTPEEILTELGQAPSEPRSKRAKAAAADVVGAAAADQSHTLSPVAETLSPSKGDGPPTPQDFGYDEKELNRKFAYVVMGGKPRVFVTLTEAKIQDRRQIWTLDAFNGFYANRRSQITDSTGKIKTITWAQRWMTARDRRTYQGVEFHPDPINAPGTPGYLNLWEGFSVEPAAAPDWRRYKTFRDHLLVNVCRGNQDRFKWLFGFFAQIVQRPRDPPGTAVILTGKMGTGKTLVGEIIGRLFPPHYFLVDDPRYVTGQFNAHMATCLLLQADEAVWAGDKAAEGRLKGLITAPIQQIEAKGVDPIRLPNYVRLIMTSNEDWVVPAGKDERRFVVLDVDPRCAQDHSYFGEMNKELAAGGLQHLLADLLAFDIGSVNLRSALRTEALLEQKVMSFDPITGWWYGRLMAGTIIRRSNRWAEQVATSNLFNDYIATADRIGVKRKQEETVFGIKMAKIVPALLQKKVRRAAEVEDHDGNTVTRRVWCYQMPSLAEARAAFERQLGQTVSWPVDDEPTEGYPDADDIAF